MRRRVMLWSGFVAFQVVYGVVVFLAARELYEDQSAKTDYARAQYQGASRQAPHPIPAGMPRTSGLAALPGSERITVEDAERLVAGSTGEKFPASSAGPKELASAADRHFAKGLYQQAATEYARILAMAPENVDIHNNLGLTLHYVGRSEEAIDILKKGIAIGGNHQRIWLTLGFVQSGMGDVDAARSSLSIAAKMDPDSRIGLEAKRLMGELPAE